MPRVDASMFTEACDKVSIALNANDQAEVVRLMEFAKGDVSFLYWLALMSTTAASINDRLRDNPAMMRIAGELLARGLMTQRQHNELAAKNARLLACTDK